MTCLARAGLLVLRVCGQPAVGACASCGRPLCAAHIGAGTCPECLAVQANPQENEYARQSAIRNSYYNDYGEQSQYGDAGYFSDADRESLGAAGAAFGSGQAAAESYDALDT